jgi:phage-related protein
MPIVQIRKGSKFTIYAWGTEDSCEVLEFLKDPKRVTKDDKRRLLTLINSTAENGPITNIRQCRALQGDHADGIYEFKAISGTARIMWFYDKGNLIICTHGFSKKGKQTPLNQIAKAQAIRKQYFKEKNNDE